MNKLFKPVLLISLILYSITSAASEPSVTLAGIWKHDEQPVWVQISKQEDVVSGVFLRHDIKPELNGEPFIKQFSPDQSNASLWNGLVYATRLKEFKSAKIIQDSADAFTLTVRVKMGFVKRKVVSNWSRSKSVSAQQ